MSKAAFINGLTTPYGLVAVGRPIPRPRRPSGSPAWRGGRSRAPVGGTHERSRRAASQPNAGVPYAPGHRK